MLGNYLQQMTSADGIFRCIFSWRFKGSNQVSMFLSITYFCRYPDVKVRAFAVDCLRKMPTDALIDFIPQLIQVIS